MVKEHNIELSDIYNIDERGACLGEAGIERYIVSKSEKRPKSIHDGSREWATLLEYISLAGAVLPE